VIEGFDRNRTIRVTVLVENTVNAGGLTAEHGLAYLIEAGERRMLFDTGQMDALVRNAAKLGQRLDNIDTIVLSHGHYDHTGGLALALSHSPKARLFLHPAALEQKYTFDKRLGKTRSIGMPPECAQALQKREVVWTPSVTDLGDGFYVTGSVPRATTFETAEQNLFADPECTRPDSLLDDQSLFFESQEGLVVLLGCAHAGVINTLAHIQSTTANRPIHTIMGGMHLLNASPDRLRQTIGRLKGLKVQKLIPLHCAGWEATLALWQTMPKQCVVFHAGLSIEFLR